VKIVSRYEDALVVDRIARIRDAESVYFARNGLFIGLDRLEGAGDISIKSLDILAIRGYRFHLRLSSSARYYSLEVYSRSGELIRHVSSDPIVDPPRRQFNNPRAGRVGTGPVGARLGPVGTA